MFGLLHQLSSVMLDLRKNHAADGAITPEESINPFAAPLDRLASNHLLQSIIAPRRQELPAKPNSLDPWLSFKECLPNTFRTSGIFACLIEGRIVFQPLPKSRQDITSPGPPPLIISRCIILNTGTSLAWLALVQRAHR